MLPYNSTLFLFVICVNCLVLYALPREGILGGFEVKQEFFTYQVAIFGRENFSDIDHLLCSGAIISAQHVASAAQCFIDTHINLLDLTFTIMVGTDDLNTNAGIALLVELIYISLYDFIYGLNDFAVVKVEDNAFRIAKLNLQKLRLPEPHESFVGEIAVVSGYGYNWVETITDSAETLTIRSGGGTDFKLRAALVEVMRSGRCSEWYPGSNPYKVFCGLMYSTPPGAAWGACSLDTGAPLASKGKLLGILTKNSINCDDTVQGGLYTKVKYNLSFINDILNNKRPVNSLVFQNREYIEYKKI